MPEPRSDSDRELVVSRVIDAPRELVFAAWTSPDHLPRWYGPRGFSTTIHAMDVRVGGTTKLTMHGPDGTRYPNTLVYREVVAPERLVYANTGGREGAEPSELLHVVTFEPHGAGTKLTLRLEMASAAAKAEVIARYRADEGGRETLDRLGAHVAEMTFDVDPDRPRITMTRVFDAPAMLVFATLVTREHLARWWGPRSHALVGCELDVRPGGAYRFVLRDPGGREHPFAGEFREVVPPRKLVMTMCYDVPEYAKHVSTVTAALADFGTRTLLELVEEFPTMAARDGKVASGMKGGAVDSHVRLGELLDDLVVRGTELELERTFAAPRALVWDAFTKPEHVKRWLAPPPLTLPVFTCDLRPGGAIAMVMRAPDGTEFPSTGTVREVVPHERFAWHGKIHGDIEVETVVTFADDGARTRITVRQTYSRVGLPTMGAKMGWQGSLDALDRVIGSLL
jgi:uncharacterized protein YndB with AHSA1/START domain